jgi:hypothetical protein
MTELLLKPFGRYGKVHEVTTACPFCARVPGGC